MLTLDRHSPSENSLATSLVGSWRRFGVVGPVYEVIGASIAQPKGERRLRVRVVETGEELDYRLQDILDDPKAG